MEALAKRLCKCRLIFRDRVDGNIVVLVRTLSEDEAWSSYLLPDSHFS